MGHQTYPRGSASGPLASSPRVRFVFRTLMFSPGLNPFLGSVFRWSSTNFGARPTSRSALASQRYMGAGATLLGSRFFRPSAATKQDHTPQLFLALWIDGHRVRPPRRAAAEEAGRGESRLVCSACRVPCSCASCAGFSLRACRVQGASKLRVRRVQGACSRRACRVQGARFAWLACSGAETSTEARTPREIDIPRARWLYAIPPYK